MSEPRLVNLQLPDILDLSNGPAELLIEFSLEDLPSEVDYFSSRLYFENGFYNSYGILARKALKEHGMTFIDRLGTPRARPEIAIERDSSISFARLIRELDLNFDKTEERTRPPALLSNRS